MPTKQEIQAARVGMSVKAAAELAGVTHRTWEGYEQGRPIPEGVWLLFQLQADIHPTLRVCKRRKRKSG